MIAETVSLGILSIPSVLAAVGIVGGLILVIGLGLIATYTVRRPQPTTYLRI
jgi:hypothetical protein